MDTRAHEYVGLTEIMPADTLQGIADITKLYFVIFAAFKESTTLNLVQRSFKVINFGAIESPCTAYKYRPLIVTFAVS